MLVACIRAEGRCAVLYMYLGESFIQSGER